MIGGLKIRVIVMAFAHRLEKSTSLKKIVGSTLKLLVPSLF